MRRRSIWLYLADADTTEGALIPKGGIIQTRTASRSCGRLRATCEGEPPRVILCDCTQCQKRTDSVYSVAAYFERTQVHTEEAFKRFRRSSDSGQYMDFAFCPDCGSTVFWELERSPDRIGVAAGAFSDPDFPPPHIAVWIENKYRWVPLPDGIPTSLKQT